MKTKVVHIITALNTGGAEGMLLNLLRLSSNRDEHRVIALSSMGVIGEKIRDLGVQVDALNMRPRRPNALAFVRLVFLLAKIKPAIVHTWLYHADLMGGLAARLARVPHVMWNVCNSHLPAEQIEPTTRMVAKMNAVLSRWVPDIIVTVSRAGIAGHVELGYQPGRFRFVPNGVEVRAPSPNVENRRSTRVKLGISQDAVLIGLIARFDPAKNHEGFLEAASVLHKKRPDAHFIMIGPGVDRSNALIMNAITAMALDDVVHPLGFQEDIIGFTSALDIAVSSSHVEGFSTTICEAMMCGVPCVVTNVGDSAYIVATTGRVVPPGNATAMSAALEDLLRLPKEKLQLLGASARQRAVEQFGVDLMVRSYEAIYHQLTTGDAESQP